MGLQSINMKTCMATWIISMSLAMLQINPVVVCTDPEEDAYMRLKDYVFNQPRIKYKMPPDIQNRGPVYFAFLPFQIASADEVDQTVTLTILLYMEWMLPNIGWNASDYGDLKEISVGQDEIWTPSIMAPKSKGNHIVKMPDVLIISNQGAVKAKKLTTMTTFCTIDLFNLPFDEHTCAVPFIETSGYVIQAFPNPELFRTISQKFSSSAEWIITDTGCSMDLFQSNNISNAGVGLKFTECCFTMKRQSAYYVNLLISPVVIMALMARVVFCIPAESGEKISLIVSLFVAMTVFLIILTDITPRSMQRQPRVMTFVVSVVAEIVCITIATAYVLQRYHRDCNTKNVIKDGVSQPKSANKATNQTTLNKVADDGSVEASVAGVAYNTHNGRGKRPGLCSYLSKLMVDVFSGKDLTHRQLDTLFFIFFLVSGVVIHTMVLSI